ncbi:SDR family NAD(P)-dependent oxidoreductase [Blastococcus brunescens]|uniref:SDR family NAD(P)-dependent oxidoreductase n=1 Tax=Blastococcus brunescens TaxID=1564165 RepID=A0ABZ1AWI3_9ACTN|nr:SDR family NAD(P)-dependent oxidoreductase [Blastococcus sp. BMG 8361]WRL62819.1 SDR family NAD(P)-dependent oxidoreductase [Blastococcus sp. BMG 8361]
MTAPHLLVVGAGPGISQATARRLGAQGFAVGLVARRDGPLGEVGRALRGGGVRTEWTTADAGDPRSLTPAVESLTAALGPVGVLLYNVSVGRSAAVPDLAPDDLLGDLAAGAVGLQTAVLAVLPGMRERGAGTVLVTGGGSADRPVPSMASLGVQKAALRALAEVQARALAPDGIHVAAVTVRGLVGDGDRRISPERVAGVYADLVAETAGPREDWRTVVDLTVQ